MDLTDTGSGGATHQVAKSTNAFAGIHYTAVAPTTLTFNPGVVSQPVTVAVLDENTVNGNHNVVLELSNVSSVGDEVLVPPPTAGLVITDIDSETGFDFDVYSVDEDTGTASISVSRSGSTVQSSSVNFTTVAETGAGKASSGADYTQVTGTLNFALLGDTTKTFTVTITVISCSMRATRRSSCVSRILRPRP